MKKRVLLLAVSSKGKNYCVAGVDIDSGSFVRLVSSDPSIDYAIDRKLFKYTQYANTPRKLHIISVNVDRHLEKDGAQTENWLSLINEDVEFVYKCSKFPADLIPAISELPYGDNCPFIDEQKYLMLDHSIEVIKARNIYFTEGENSSGEKRIRINFIPDNGDAFFACYDFRLTDPGYAYQEGILEKTIESAYLVITVGPLDNKGFSNRYKFVSGIHEL